MDFPRPLGTDQSQADLGGVHRFLRLGTLSIGLKANQRQNSFLGFPYFWTPIGPRPWSSLSSGQPKPADTADEAGEALVGLERNKTKRAEDRRTEPPLFTMFKGRQTETNHFQGPQRNMGMTYLGASWWTSCRRGCMFTSVVWKGGSPR